MRKINKNVAPQRFSDMCLKNKPANWDEFHRNHQEIYNDCRETLLINEQDCLCGYTELPIKNSTDTHIDHYRKKSLFPELCFEWNNFIASTNSDDFGARYKDNKYCSLKSDYQTILNPITDDCVTYFEYNSFGYIKPQNGLNETDKEKAEKTIEVFNLNHNSLKSRRQVVIQFIKSHLSGDLPAVEIEKALSSGGFKSVVEQELIIES
ncbi:MAG: TIGR02646 family protein [Bacteroidales bacterium]|jgi:uncharacterized protein (TIGR02646 family)|nr:TIGR02646 family protein [Bacteroidales bacterium]